jgi:hypothetical protein
MESSTLDVGVLGAQALPSKNTVQRLEKIPWEGEFTFRSDS